MAKRRTLGTIPRIIPHYEDAQLRETVRKAIEGLPPDSTVAELWRHDRPTLEIIRALPSDCSDVAVRLTAAYVEWVDRSDRSQQMYSPASDLTRDGVGKVEAIAETAPGTNRGVIIAPAIRLPPPNRRSSD